jgi:signal transduction histidine kinase
MADTTRPPRFRFQLRRTMLVCAVALTVLTTVACLSLKIMTDLMGMRAEELHTAAAHVHAAERIRNGLLEDSRLANIVLLKRDDARERERTDVQTALHRDIDELRATEANEHGGAVDKALSDIEAYTTARRTADEQGRGGSVIAAATSVTPALDAAMASMADLVRGDTARMDRIADKIRFWDTTGDIVGWVVAALVLAGMVLAIVGLYRLVFRPALNLTERIREFAAGNRDARATPSAAVELASAADGFNEMAAVIVGQHARMVDFLGSVAGELEDPIHHMRTSLQDFAPKKPLPSEDKIRNRMAILSREVERLDRLTENFVDASRVEWERLDLQQDQQDLTRIACDAAKLYEAYSSIYKVVVNAPDQPVRVFSDRDRISHVLHTLISNAIDRSRPDAIVNVTVAVEGRDAVVTVTDHGEPIPQARMATLFTPFRGVMAGDGPHIGASLALSVAKRIVEAHGGRIEAKTGGDGSTFSVHLPEAKQLRAEDRRAEKREEQRPAPPVAATRKPSPA